MKIKKTARILVSLLCSIILFALNVIPVSAICCRKDGFDKSKYQGKLTGDMAKDVAIIAKSQNGRTGSQIGYSGVDKNGWCDEFVADCIELAGGDSNIVAHGGTVKDFYNVMTSKGAVPVSTPQAGDLVFYRRSSDGGWPHVAIMTGSTESAHGNIWLKGYGQVYVMSYKSYGDGNGNKVGSGLYVQFVRPAYKSTVTNTVTFYRNLDSSDTYKVKESFTTGVKNQKFGYYPSGEGRYNPMNPENVGFGQWTKPGYDLLGWSKDRNATEKTWKTYSDVADSWIRENSAGVNLYLVWRPHVYTVSFESDSELLSDTAQVTFGTAYGTLPVPVKKNANFEGWYTADGTLITADSVYTATADQTLFARWSEKKLTGDANGDGSVNMKDIAVLNRYLNNWNVNIDLSACDLNTDGTVNMKDLALLKKLLNN